MAFENVQVTSTRNAVSPIIGYRQDLVIADVIVASLTSNVGVSSFRWELVGRPEGSVAGGAGPEPIFLSASATATFTVDSDTGFNKDGTYIVQCTLNGGSPTETRIRAALVRLTGITISGSRPLRKIGGFESLDDSSVAATIQGWATQLNRWLEQVRTLTGGGGGGQTLAQVYAFGSAAADQTPILTDSDGGGIFIDGSSGAFTGAFSFKVAGAASAAGLYVDRASGRVGVGTFSPASPFQFDVLGQSRFSVSDAVTSTQTEVARFEHNTSGTAALGFGTTVLWRNEASSGSLIDAAKVVTKWTNPTAASQNTAQDFQVSEAGVLTTLLSLSGTSHTVGIGDNPEDIDPGLFAGVRLAVFQRDAATSTAPDVEKLYKRSTGTPAAGFGAAHLTVMQNSALAFIDATRLTERWQVATAGSEASEFRFETKIPGKPLGPGNDAGATAGGVRLYSGTVLITSPNAFAGIQIDNASNTVTMTGPINWEISGDLVVGSLPTAAARARVDVRAGAISFDEFSTPGTVANVGFLYCKDAAAATHLFFKSDNGTEYQLTPPSGGGVGGSGTATRVAFWTAATTLGDDANFYWDNTGKQLGLGTTSPSARLTATTNASTPPAPPAGTVGHIIGSGDSIFTLDAFSAMPILVGRVAGGTAAAPSAIAAADVDMLLLRGIGRGATAYSTAKASISLASSEGWTDTAQGTRIKFSTTSNGTAVLTERVRIENSGHVGIGTTAPDSRLTVSTNSTTLPAAPTALGETVVHVGGPDFADPPSPLVVVDAFGSKNPTIIGRSAGGTIATPSATTIATNLWRIIGVGRGTTGYSTNNVEVTALANETWTDTARGTIISFLVTPNGTAGSLEKFRMTDQGDFQVYGNSNAVSVGVSDAGAGKIRYSDLTNTFQVSVNGGNYANLISGGNVDGQFTRDLGTVCTGTSEQLLAQWTWDTADLAAAFANIVPSIQIVATSSDSLGIFKVRIGGTIDSPTTGTVVITSASLALSATALSLTGSSFAKPAGGATLVKLTGVAGAAGSSVTLKSIHLRMLGVQ